MDHTERLKQWLEGVSGPEYLWFAKRLSANDTGQTGAHQVGFYVPKSFAFTIAPELNTRAPNPKRTFSFNLVSHDQRPEPDLTYYNQKTRDECRFTRFGGSASALQDPQNTTALLFLAFRRGTSDAEGWVATSAEQEDLIGSTAGPTVPGTITMRIPDPQGNLFLKEEIAAPEPCRPAMSELPAAWATTFPTGDELANEAIRRTVVKGLDADRRILRRYRCETSLFQVVQDAHLGPILSKGFKNPAEFIKEARRVLNQRMSRAGGALELHLAKIFDEEEVRFCRGCITEATHKPDFIFPSIAGYHGAAVRSSGIEMLAAKTTLKDRWRQILREADKIPRKHLFTLVEGVSVPQFKEITAEDVVLVVPAENLVKFPAPIRSQVKDLRSFIKLVKPLA